MKNKIRCKECPMMRIPFRSKENWLNFRNTRGWCFCTHPDVHRVFFASDLYLTRTIGFICYTYAGSNIPAIKTAPRWCPRKISAPAKGEENDDH